MIKDSSKILISIVNYNGYKETIKCLKSLICQNYPNFSIFVLDNGSINNSFGKINLWAKNLQQKKSKMKIDVVRSDKNLGFAGGHNLVIKKNPEADYYFLLNPDTELDPNCLSELMKLAKKKTFRGKEIAFLGPRIFYLDKKTVYSNGGSVNKFLTEATLKDHGKTKDELKEVLPFETAYITGTALLVSQAVVEKIGLMREDYFLYYEDSDWAVRASQAGFIHTIVPRAIVYHKGYHSTKHLSYNYIYYLTRNGYFLAWNNGRAWQKIFVIFYSGYKFLKQPLKFVFAPTKRNWVLPILRATWDFWRGRRGKLQF